MCREVTGDPHLWKASWLATLTQLAETPKFYGGYRRNNGSTLNFSAAYKKGQTSLGDSGGGQKTAKCHSQQRKRSARMKHLLAMWRPGEAVRRHHCQVLTPLGLQAHLCFDGIQLCHSLLSSQSSCFKFLPPSNCDGQQDGTGCIQRHERERKQEKHSKERQKRWCESHSPQAWLSSALPDQLFPKLRQSAHLHDASISSLAELGSPHILWPQRIFAKPRNLQRVLQTRMPNYYLIIQWAQIRRRQVKPQINLMPYAMGCIIQQPSKAGIYTICGFILFHVKKHGHTSKQTQLNLNYPVEDYPRFLLFLLFSCCPFFSPSGDSSVIKERWWQAGQ